MSSLWTPGGEHRVPDGEHRPVPPDAPDPDGLDEGAPPPTGHPVPGEVDPRGADGTREEIAALERELVEAPVEDIVANHCYGLFQLAAVHLGQQPPHLGEARIAIDALGAVVERLGDRLGPSAPTLGEAVAQIRLAFVQIAGASAQPPGDPPDPTPR